MQSLTDLIGPITYALIVVVFEIIPIKIAASLIHAERSDWASCILVSLVAGSAASFLAISFGGYGDIAGLLVKAVIISAILGADIIAAVVISIVAGFVSTGLMFVLFFLITQLA